MTSANNSQENAAMDNQVESADGLSVAPVGPTPTATALYQEARDMPTDLQADSTTLVHEEDVPEPGSRLLVSHHFGEPTAFDHVANGVSLLVDVFLAVLLAYVLYQVATGHHVGLYVS